jgi:serine/threonine-protein kinase RsbW
MNSDNTSYSIIRMTVVAKKELIPAITSAVRSIALQFGFDEKEVLQLELIVEEASLNVIEHAFEEGEMGLFDVIIDRKPGQLVIAIEDMGLPFDFTKADSSENSGLGMLLIKSLADEVKFINLGRKGKRIELIKSLRYKDIEEYVSADELGESKNLPKALADEQLSFVMMKTEEAVNLARCVYRSYGYSYPNDTIYFPERRKELLDSGIIEACIVLNSSDEVVGHLAMLKDTKDAKVGESGQAVVDPRYRGRSLFKEMKIFLSEHARNKGMYGLYSEAVSIHPYTQKGNISLGAHETGFLLAFAPESMNFKQIKDKQKQRQTTVLFYHRINEEPHRDVYLPYHHATIIKMIYEKQALNRNFAILKKENISCEGKSVIDLKVLPDLALAFLQVQSFGEDFEGLVEFRLKEMLKRKMDCIYIDLPLSMKETPYFCAIIEQFGFFFAGIIPELYDGDVLRLQYLNNLEVDSKDICTASDFGRELLNYVLKEGGFRI